MTQHSYRAQATELRDIEDVSYATFQKDAETEIVELQLKNRYFDIYTQWTFLFHIWFKLFLENH